MERPCPPPMATMRGPCSRRRYSANASTTGRSGRKKGASNERLRPHKPKRNNPTPTPPKTSARNGRGRKRNDAVDSNGNHQVSGAVRYTCSTSTANPRPRNMVPRMSSANQRLTPNPGRSQASAERAARNQETHRRRMASSYPEGRVGSRSPEGVKFPNPAGKGNHIPPCGCSVWRWAASSA